MFFERKKEFFEKIYIDRKVVQEAELLNLFRYSGKENKTVIGCSNPISEKTGFRLQ